jgi:hypothetical protein
MLDLPDQPVIDKQALIGGCVRLPLRVDATRLRAEVAALPAELWAGTDGRVGVHRVTQSLFLRGYAPAQGNLPIEPRPALQHLPYVREIIESLVPAAPQRCVLAALPAGAVILPHIDRAPYFSKTLRLHVPVSTHDQAWMLAGALAYRMAAGEVWVLNNVAPHAVWNAHATESRMHLICDFLPSPALLELLARGERDLGREEPAVSAHFAALGHRP